MGETFDFIVVGAGTAGCVLAARLAASGRHRVLLLEAGGEARSPWIGLPVGYAKLLGDRRYNWMYRTQPESALGGRVLDVPSGRTIGGTGSINGMIYVRGHRGDYDAWRDAGNEGWGYDDVLPWFIRSEANSRGADGFHGGSGPLAVSDVQYTEPLSEAFIEAATQAGLPHNRDFNGPDQDGAGRYQLNIAKGRRASTATAYLEPARRRGNLVVHTGATADRLIFDGLRANGIGYSRGGVQMTAFARHEVVVAAGTFNSPALLLRSGIGGGAQLAAHGIAVVAARPGVGENLQNHYRASIVMRCQEPVTLNDAMQSTWKRIGMGLQYALSRGGPLSAGTLAGGFFRSSSAESRPDMQLTFWNYSVEKRDSRGLKLHPFPGFTVNTVLIRPKSTGHVRLASAAADAAPAITYNHLAHEDDRQKLAAGLRITRQILSMPAMARWCGNEVTPGPAVDDDESLFRFMRESGNSVFHPVGTCRMGSDEGAVVDSRLRVHGVTGLRVADASVMPTVVAGNTNAPVVMIAERAAAWILEDCMRPAIPS